MRVIGLTGSVGTGKSTVAKLFAELGAKVIDADRIARQVVEPNRPAWREVIRAFGRGLLRADKTLDRDKLSGLVFANPAKRHKLERIIHPRVARQMRKELRHHKRMGAANAVIVLDVPLLFEVGWDNWVDDVIVVTAARSVQNARLRRRHGWSQKEVDARIRSQWTLAAKVALADHVVNNTGSMAATRKQVKQLWRNKLVTPRNNPVTPRNK